MYVCIYFRHDGFISRCCYCRNIVCICINNIDTVEINGVIYVTDGILPAGTIQLISLEKHLTMRKCKNKEKNCTKNHCDSTFLNRDEDEISRGRRMYLYLRERETPERKLIEAYKKKEKCLKKIHKLQRAINDSSFERANVEDTTDWLEEFFPNRKKRFVQPEQIEMKTLRKNDEAVE